MYFGDAFRMGSAADANNANTDKLVLNYSVLKGFNRRRLPLFEQYSPKTPTSIHTQTNTHSHKFLTNALFVPKTPLLPSKPSTSLRVA